MSLLLKKDFLLHIGYHSYGGLSTKNPMKFQNAPIADNIHAATAIEGENRLQAICLRFSENTIQLSGSVAKILHSFLYLQGIQVYHSPFNERFIGQTYMHHTAPTYVIPIYSHHLLPLLIPTFILHTRHCQLQQSHTNTDTAYSPLYA